MAKAASHLVLPNDGMFSSLEAFLGGIGSNQSRELEVSAPLDHAPVGYSIAQMQALLTWAKLQKAPSIVFRDEAFLEKQTLSPLEICAARISHTAISHSSKMDRRPLVVANAIRENDNLYQSLESSKLLSEYWIIIPDGTSQAFPRLLYTPHEQVKLAEAFYFLITKAVSLLLRKFNIPPNALNELTRRSLGTVIYELFKNTNDWARTSWDGTRVKRSIRAIHIRALTQKEVRISPKTTMLDEFLIRRGKSCSALIEVSILDSGPGYAQRFGKRPLTEIASTDTEYGLIQDCMTVHHSTSEDPRKGVGLHGVLYSIDSVRGFIKLRTGRLSLCRPLDLHRYVESAKGLPATKVGRHKPWLMDSETRKVLWTEMPNVTGALITAIIPVEGL